MAFDFDTTEFLPSVPPSLLRKPYVYVQRISLVSDGSVVAAFLKGQITTIRCISCCRGQNPFPEIVPAIDFQARPQVNRIPMHFVRSANMAGAEN